MAEGKPDIVRAVADAQKTELFGIDEATIQTDPAFNDPYKNNHKSSVNIAVFLGPIWVEEAAGFEIQESNSKQPIYNYAAPYHSGVAEGKYLAKGNLYIYETKTQAFLSLIAKYKTLVDQDRLDEVRVREIVAERANLFRANIEASILSRFSAGEVASGQLQKFTLAALERINSEVITGKDWNIPKLVVVSGDAIDKEPLVDVFEDVTFTSASKSTVSDGATQVQVYGWFAKKRPTKEPKIQLAESDKWLLDLDLTVKNFCNKILNRIKKNIGVSIQTTSSGLSHNPNNIMYSGTYPDAICSWGPKFCVRDYKVIQYGAPETLNETVDMVLYRIEDVPTSTGGTNTVGDNVQPTRTLYIDEAAQPKIGTVIPGAWNYFYPDMDYLLTFITASGRTLPTSRAFSFSWFFPPPAVDPRSAYIYKEEERHMVSGSMLTAAWFSTAFLTSRDRKKATVVTRQPVRDYAYLSNPFVKKDGDKPVLRGRKPIPMQIVRHARAAGFDPFPLATDEGMEITSAGTRQSTADASLREKWLWFTPDGFTLTALLSLGGISEIFTKALEAITLGILGNIDKVNKESVDISSIFFNDEFKANAIGVQVFGVSTPTKNISALDFLNPDPTGLFADPQTECLHEGFRYVWSITGLNSLPTAGTPDAGGRLEFAHCWDKDVLIGLMQKERLPAILVRVCSGNPEIPNDVITKDKYADIKKTAFDLNENVAASTHVPSAMAEHNISIRCDRNYFAFPKRPPWSWLDTASVQLATITLENQLWMNTLMASNLQPAWRRTAELDAQLNRSGAAAAGATFLRYAVIEPLRTTVNLVEGTYGVFTSLPLISQVLDVFSAGGIDFAGIFRDSTIVEATKVPVVSMYADSERYVVLLSQLADIVSEQIRNALLDPTLAKKIDMASQFKDNTKDFTGAVRDKTHTYLYSEMYKVFDVNINSTGVDNWAIQKVPGDTLTIFGSSLKPKDEESSSNLASRLGTRSIDALFLTRSGTRPSPLILDAIGRKLKVEDEPLAGNLKGIKVAT